MNEISIGSGNIASPRNVNFDWMTILQWYELFSEHKKITKQGNVDILLLGDSLIENWTPCVLKRYFPDVSIANFGIGGDHTGNVLWRLQNMNFNTFKPKVIVLQLGVNNIGHLNEEVNVIVSGIKKVISACLLYMPTSKILLNGLFPYNASADDSTRSIVKDANSALAKFADNKKIYYQYYGDSLLEADGTISSKVMPDFLHPSVYGYDIWAKAMAPDLKKLLIEAF